MAIAGKKNLLGCASAASLTGNALVGFRQPLAGRGPNITCRIQAGVWHENAALPAATGADLALEKTGSGRWPVTILVEFGL